MAAVWGKGKQGRNLMPGTNPYQKVLTYLHGLGAKANKTIKVLTLSTQFHASSGRFTVKSINTTKYNKKVITDEHSRHQAYISITVRCHWQPDAFQHIAEILGSPWVMSFQCSMQLHLNVNPWEKHDAQFSFDFI